MRILRSVLSLLLAVAIAVAPAGISAAKNVQKRSQDCHMGKATQYCPCDNHDRSCTPAGCKLNCATLSVLPTHPLLATGPRIVLDIAAKTASLDPRHPESEPPIPRV